MTGNNKVWRAPLAGLAAVAMLATMGVAAGTANALDANAESSAFDKVGNATVKVYNADFPYDNLTDAEQSQAAGAYGYEAPSATLSPVKYGTALSADELTGNTPGAGDKDHKVLDYLSYDQAGKNKATVPYVVTGDVKLYAHYKDSVKVTFDTNENGYADAGDDTVSIAKGSSLTYADYVKVFSTDSYGAPRELAAPAGQQLAGWTLTPSASGKGSSDLYNGAAITADTVLYPRFDSGTNLATVRFQEQGNRNNYITRYTLVDSPFQEFRAPLDWAKSFSDAAFAGWTVSGSKYDFTTPVANVPGSALSDADLTIIASKSNSLQNVKVKYVFNTGDQDLRTADDYTTTTDQKVKEPVNPVRAGYVFTGWYTEQTATGVVSNKFEFNTAIDQQPGLLSNGTLTLYAGWNKVNAAKLVFNLGYTDFTLPQQVLYVYEGDKVDLPAGLEEYSQTQAQKDALKGEFTAKTLKGWYEGNDPKQVVTSTTAPKAGTVRSYTAVWEGAESLFLDANGGNFGGAVTRKWVTKTDSQKWQDVVVEPTRDGYYFNGWKDKAGHTANLSDGFLSDSTGTKVGVIGDGTVLYAQWSEAPATDIDSAFLAYPLLGATASNDWTPSFASKQKDYALWAKYAKSEAGWKSYVDTVYSLKDDFLAIKKLSGVEKYNAQKALAAKLQAAQEKLTDYQNPKGEVTVFRLFNPNEKRAGSHHYTADVTEYNGLVRAGWQAEGVAFVTTEDGDPVYRAYNPNDGSHFYTLDKAEFDTAVAAGWRDEGVAFKVADSSKTPLYRLYNPNSGEHFYTTDKAEAQKDIAAGWRDEGIAWNVIK